MSHRESKELARVFAAAFLWDLLSALRLAAGTTISYSLHALPLKYVCETTPCYSQEETMASVKLCRLLLAAEPYLHVVSR